MHVVCKLPDPSASDTLLAMVFKDWKRNRNPAGDQRLPITIEEMRRLKTALHASKMCLHDNLMLWSACSLVFFGFMRV